MKTKIQSLITFCILGISMLSSPTLQAQSGWLPHLYFGIPAEDKQTVFFDEFNNNRNKWNLESNFLDMRISDGDFFCQSNNDRTYVKRRFVPVNYSGDYEIEISMRYVRGQGKGPMGLTFGRDVAGNEYNFYFDTEGRYRIFKYENRRETPYVNWRSTPLLGVYSYNTLTVRKVGYTWFFYLNREKVHQCQAETLFGYDMGFTIGGNMAVEVDYIKVMELKSSDTQGPTIFINEPYLGRTMSVKVPTPRTRIEGKVLDPSGVKEILVKYNYERITVKPDAVGSFGYELNLSKINTKDGLPITLEAIDNFGNKTSKIFYVTYEAPRPKPQPQRQQQVYNQPTPPRHKGKNYLLTIGINDYLYWSPLHNASKDCKDIEEVLFREYTFNRGDAIHLRDQDATRENIIEAMQSLEAKITKHDNLLIYYAGHGYYDHKSERGYWVPVNARQNKISDYIRNSTIHDYLSSIDSHNTLLIADACYAGSLFSRNRGVLNEESPSRWAFTSGDIEKVWDGQPGENSPFAKYLIYYLEENTKRKLKADDLINTVKTSVMRNTSQTPIGDPLQNVGDMGGVFIFYRR